MGEVDQRAWYECESCHGKITDAHKTVMLRTGEWRATTRKNDNLDSVSRKVAFHLNTLYSPWVRFGEMARKFLECKDDPDDLKDFIKDWLGEPFEETARTMSSDLVLDRQALFEEGVVPDEAQMLTAGVDVQQESLYWTIRAWAPGMTSWNVMHGQALTWGEIDTVMNRCWYKRTGEPLRVSLCAIDSGDGNTQEEVYDFCALNTDWTVAIKGSSTPMTTRYQIGRVDKAGSRANGMRLIRVDGAQYKSTISARLNRPNGRGSWMVYYGCDREYAAQVTSEHCVPEVKAGRHVDVWKPKTDGTPNHYLDAEVYCMLAAEVMGARYMAEDEVPADGEQGPGPGPSPAPPADSLAHNSVWLQPVGRWM